MPHSIFILFAFLILLTSCKDVGEDCQIESSDSERHKNAIYELDLIPFLLENRLLYRVKNNTTIKLYIDDSDFIPCNGVLIHATLEDAITEINNELALLDNVRVVFAIAGLKDNKTYTVKFTELETFGKLCLSWCNGEGFSSIEIRLKTILPYCGGVFERNRLNRIREVFKHELIHFLGIHGHDPDSKATINMVTEKTGRTLEYIYSQTPDILIK